MVVQHNLTAMNANRYLGINNNKLSKSLEKLSSGYQINRAGDNAAGLAVSEKMRSQIAGMTQGVKNAQDGISMVQTFEGALTETDSILQRMKVLADQMSNGTYDNEVDRSAAQLEFDQLNDELNQIADTDFNGVVVLNGGTMADGTVATNNTTVAGKPLVRTNAVSDPASSAVYQKLVAGGVDAGGNGTIVVNGTSIDIKSGTGGASVGSTTYAAENLKKKDDGSGWDTTGKVTATTVLQVNPDTTKITIFGKSYIVNNSVTTAADVAAYNDKKQAAYDEIDGDDDLNGTQKADAKKQWDAANPEVKEGDGKIQLINSNGKELTAADLGVKTLTIDSDAQTITIEEEYVLQKDGTLKDNAGDGTRMGKLDSKSDVSVSNAFQHGRRNLTYTNNITLQVGARSKDAVNFTFEYTTSGIGDLNADLDCSARGLGTAQLSLATAEKANEAIDHIDNAINKVSMVRATFGAIQNRLEHKIDNLNVSVENLTSAESAIRDTNMPTEMMNFTKQQILSQASQSMLAQANQLPQSVLSLLQ